MEKQKKRRGLNLYQKFVLVIVIVGILPMAFLATVMINRMMAEFKASLKLNYRQAVSNANVSVEQIMESCNDISKMSYYYSNYSGEGSFRYDYMNFDNLRRIVHGIGYEPDTMEDKRRTNMMLFLDNVQTVDSSAVGAHFMALDQDGNTMAFNRSKRNPFFQDEELFLDAVKWKEWDTATKQLVILPPHSSSYFKGSAAEVFTVARNYFDLSKNVGDTPYVGTLFIDMDLKRLEGVFENLELPLGAGIFLTDEAGNCFYSNEESYVGKALAKEEHREEKGQIIVTSRKNRYGMSTAIVIDEETAYQNLNRIKHMMYLFIGVSIVLLVLGSIIFSKRLTSPIHRMMDQMSEIESGNFKVSIPVSSNDEIGILSERFNRMSAELETYINKSYLAQMKQSEAEMTALKSQIYPHFLYNTLEVIRMTALENDDHMVSKMIESLSQQIRYMIGPSGDIVPLEMEADIVEKYVFLLNCRIAGQVLLNIRLHGCSRQMVPKLILQPIVENAYVHGIKPKDGSGHIMIETEQEENNLVITVMDNGSGMDETELKQLYDLMEGDAIGIKNQHNWQSIGLKNVNDRLKYLYGTEFGLQITSTPMVGTMVRIVLPYEVIARDA